MKSLFTILLSTLCLATASAQTRKYQVAPGIQATITHTPGAATVDAALVGVELITLDITQPGTNTFQIKTADYNFDGYKDFALMAVNQSTGMQTYDIFLYHPTEKTFEALDLPGGGVCEVFGNVRVNAGDKTLRTSCRNGAKSSLDIYKWANPFALELVKSVDNSAETRAEQEEEKADKKAEKKEARDTKKEDIKDKKAQRKEKNDDGDD